MSMIAYRALVEEAERLGLPQAFREDLYLHDRRILTLWNGMPEKFGWMLRECGTFLYFARARGQEPYTGRYFSRTMSIFPGCHLYYWDGQELRGVEPEKLARLLNGEPDEN
jgi:hypothetical protein